MTAIESLTKVSHIRAAADRARLNSLRIGHQAGSQGAHFGPALSLIEILSTLYGGVLKVAPQSMTDPNRDRLILSKGHGSLGLYTVLHEYGFIDAEMLETFEVDGGRLAGQPIRNRPIGIEFSSGSLGMGLGFGLGLALSARLADSPRNIYVVMGDGETNEGSVWEAAMAARHFNLTGLTAVVDVNDMQSDGRTSEVLLMDHARMWSGFGWDVRTVADGHDVGELLRAFDEPALDAPRVVLARTIKGKGVSFMENNLDWHHGRLSFEQLTDAMTELDGGPRPEQ